MKEQLYFYRWGNSPTRVRWKGRTVRVLWRGTMNTVCVQDVETGETMTTSGNALRKPPADRAEGEGWRGDRMCCQQMPE